ncbi:septum site-determining protein MinC [Fictibacillus aquaticus]|uniref:Probable septum site-determining protein MinC n=1 Tax=Fictibacillus aquaticus TaxID=2021314 RepID=A0A235FAW3_9BACL|nr:septum site-determining protein MinC [Fictibacillus aquaticus]OYD58067.1 septum site-determining protein MinC [Fictibacillus aquaticus]
MAQKMHHYVTIKGTKNGLVLILDDTCSFQQMLDELYDKLTADSGQFLDGPAVSVRVQAGNRFLTDDQEKKIISVLQNKKNLLLERIESNVISRAEAEEMQKEKEVTTVSKIIRSGQVLEVQGDLLLIGDVNPGGTVMASGNIFVMGAIKGIAHAGCKGNSEAVIASSVMKPSQLRIADMINRSPDHYPAGGHEMEFAYISHDENQIRIDRISNVYRIRPGLNSLLQKGE